jgi:hypothetical protein
MARPAGEFDASRYFRGTKHLGFYNVGTSRLRALATAIYREHKDAWTVDDALAFADTLVVDRYLDVKAVGIEVMARHRKAFAPRLLPAWKRWLANDRSDNWATTDSICGSLIGPLLLAQPALVRTVAGWCTHRNMWVRRASAVSLIPSARQGLALDRRTGWRGPFIEIPRTSSRRPSGGCCVKLERRTDRASSATCESTALSSRERRCAMRLSASRRRSVASC